MSYVAPTYNKGQNTEVKVCRGNMTEKSPARKKYPIVKKVVKYEQSNGIHTVRMSLVYVFGILVYMYVSNKL